MQLAFQVYMLKAMLLRFLLLKKAPCLSVSVCP